MEKYLITGEVFETKKLYSLFFTGEYFICDLGKIKLETNPDNLDLKILKNLNNKTFRNKLLKHRDNYYYSLNVENEDEKESVLVSNIKCFRDPVLISYEYEHLKSLMES